MSIKKLLFVFLMVIFSLPSHAQTAVQAVQRFCEAGGVRVTTSGLPSTNTVQASYPSCVVTVFLTGTTNKATIYTDGNSDPLVNPFTANKDGSYLFYAAAGVGLDIVMSGGSPTPFPSAVTITDLVPGGGASPITKIVAGTNITITPPTGLGEVTINSTGGGGGAPVIAGSAQYANIGATAFSSGGLYDTDVFNTANNGVALFQASGACTGSGCYGNIPASSTSTESVFPSLSVDGTHISDYRFGSQHDYFYNIDNPVTNGPINELQTNCFQNFQPVEVAIYQSVCNTINNLYSSPGYYQVGSPSSNASLVVNQNANGRGITQDYSSIQNAFKAGDIGFFYGYQNARNIEMAADDEGAVTLSLIGQEYGSPWGTIAVGGPGATIITPTQVGWSQQLGDGFNFIAQDEIFSQGLMTLFTAGIGPLPNSITTSDTHAVSTGVATLSAACGPTIAVPRNAPVSSTCTIATSQGSFSAAAGNVVCFGDWQNNFEATTITAVGSGTITVPLAFLHGAGLEIGQGGACGTLLVEGYGTTNPIGVNEDTDSGTNLFKPTSFPIVASRTATSLDFVPQYKQGESNQPNLFVPDYLIRTNGVPSYSAPIASASRTGTAVSLQMVGPAVLLNGWVLPSGSQICITGNSNSTFNICTTAQTTTTTNGNVVNFTNGSGSATGTGGTLTITNLNNYQAVVGAETIAVLGSTVANYSPTQVQLSPNVGTWAPGEHYVQVNAYNSDYSGGRITYHADTPAAFQGSELFAWNMSGAYFGGGTIFDINAFESCALYLGCGGTFPGHTFVNFHDYTKTFINMANAPINNGCIICTGGLAAGSGGSTYDLLADSFDAAFLTIHPNSGTAPDLNWSGNFAATSGTFSGALQGHSLTLDNGFTANEINGESPLYLWGGNGPLTPGDVVFVNDTFSAQDANVAINKMPSYVGNISTSGSSPAPLTVAGLATSSVCFAQGLNSDALTQTVFTSTATNTVSLNYSTSSPAIYAVFCTFPTPASVTD